MKKSSIPQNSAYQPKKENPLLSFGLMLLAWLYILVMVPVYLTDTLIFRTLLNRRGLFTYGDWFPMRTKWGGLRGSMGDKE